MRSSVQIACEVLDELENHTGFEEWWDGLADEKRDEILTRLSSVVHEDWAQQGRSAADCRAHNPEVVGSNPTPASSSSDQPGRES